MQTKSKLLTQVPGYYRYELGSFEVTALCDGMCDLDIHLLRGLPDDQIQSLLARSFVENRKVLQAPVNTYLVNTGEHLILVDAGAGIHLGPTMGKIQESIRASGYKSEDVDILLMTHLDPDHIGGALEKNGKLAFPNATLWAAQEDYDFRFNAKIAQAASENTKPYFPIAMNAVNAYKAAGKFRTFKAGDTIVDGVSTIAAHGHTPGHTVLLFTSNGKSLAMIGDMVHNHAVQFPHPEVWDLYDIDQKQAVATRLAFFERAEKTEWMFAGAHLPFPGLGHIRKESQGYAWVPVEFGPVSA